MDLQAINNRWWPQTTRDIGYFESTVSSLESKEMFVFVYPENRKLLAPMLDSQRVMVAVLNQINHCGSLICHDVTYSPETSVNIKMI